MSSDNKQQGETHDFSPNTNRNTRRYKPANISQKINELNIPKQILQKTMEKIQDTIINDLCGPIYARDPNRQYQRAATTQRTLITRHGIIKFKLVKVYDLENGVYFRPFLVYLGIVSKQRIVDDLVLECAEAASYLTYRDSKAVIEGLTHVVVSKCRVHECVQRVGAFMDVERRRASGLLLVGDDDLRKEVVGEDDLRKEVVGEEDLRKEVVGEEDLRKEVVGEEDLRKEVVGKEDLKKEDVGKEDTSQKIEIDLLLGDGTKTHGRNGKKNDINVIIGQNQTTGRKGLLGLGVNQSWTQTGDQFKGRAKVAVSDNEVALKKVLLEKSDDYQACVLHGIRDVKFYLWQAGLPKEKRKGISDRVENVLWTLRNSVNIHIVDGDFERLQWRIDWTLEQLKAIGGELFDVGLDCVARFVCNVANCLVTFARLAMKSVVVVFSNNLVERG